MDFTIRRAGIEEADVLSDIAFKSKAFWGYDDEFMELARADLSITPKSIKGNMVFVLEENRIVKGFYELRANNDQEAELNWLFVEPNSIGNGYGKQLMLHAIQSAKDRRFACIMIKSDPNAAGFYQSFGATVIGESPSTVRPAMMLPVFCLPLVPIGS